MTESLRSFDPRLTYDDASADYDDACRDFWGYMSTRTTERLGLGPGARVLDVPCGTGAALLSLAERVGPSGHVVGIDYAQRMVEIARRKVEEAGVQNVELRIGDMRAIGSAEAYDAIQCTLGLFFVDDMPDLVRSFMNLLRAPDGRLAVTVFGDRFFEPMRSVFVAAVRDEAPGVEVVEPWRRTESAAVLREVFRAAGVEQVVIEIEDDTLPLHSADDWWRVVMGSGLRRTIVSIGPDAAARVRERCEVYVQERGVTELLNRALYATATRPDAAPPSFDREAT
jgi:ubiquinone/menaquinone biosynthesis C-methylase UbiE